MGEHEVVLAGVGGRFPGSDGMPSLEKNILDNKLLFELDEKRWVKDNRLGIEPLGGFIDYEQFDHLFFGMHKRLAYWADPVAKLGYERSFEAIVDAGIHPSSMRGSNTCVYISAGISEFDSASMRIMDLGDGYVIMGHSRAMSANRISYFFDFKGHSCGYDGTNAFGQLGIEMAAEKIRTGVADAAVVVGGSVARFPEVLHLMKALGIQTDEMPRPFDKDANGSKRSDGVVALLLQRSDLAKRCYAKVLCSSSGIVGPRVKFDITLPSPIGMERYLTDMYRRAHIDPRRVAFVEACGIAKPINDMTELRAIDAVLGAGAGRSPSDPLLVGSITGNLGYTDAASGLIGVCKAVIAMETGVIPATLNYSSPNPDAKGLVDGRLKVVTKNTPLHITNDTLVAVNSMGLGGTVGHTVLQPNFKSKKAVDPENELPRLVPLAGRTEESVRKLVQKVQSMPFDPEYLHLVQEMFSKDIRGLEYRSYAICPPSPNDKIEVSQVEKRTVWWVFSGMGSQWAGMGADLMQVPVFSDTIERLHKLLIQQGIDLKSIITETGPTAFDNILKSFVGITCCQIALTNVLKSMGMVPDGMIGHSVGELGCAYADGCLSEEQTALAAAARGTASVTVPLIKGMMAAVGLGYDDIKTRLPPSIDVACRNSSTSCTLSGPAEDVQNFVNKLTEEGVFARAVNVSDIAYHSRYIKPAAPFLRAHLEKVIPHPKERSRKWISTSVPLERWSEPAARFCSAEYQTNNLLSPVLFEDCLQFIPKQATLIEIAPHGLLQAILKRELPDNVHIPLTQRGTPSPVRFLLSAIGKITFRNDSCKISKLYPEVQYPVSRGTPSLTDLVTWDHETSASYATNISTLSSADNVRMNLETPCVRVHRTPLFCVSEMLVKVCSNFATLTRRRAETIPVVFQDIHVEYWQELPVDGTNELTIALARGNGRFEILGEKDETKLWGVLSEKSDSKINTMAPLPQDALKDAILVTGKEIIADFKSRGVIWAPKFQTITSIHASDKDWEITLKQPGDGDLSVAEVLEGLIQVMMWRSIEVKHAETGHLLLPRAIQRIEFNPATIKRPEIKIRYNIPSAVMAGEGIYLSGFSCDAPKAIPAGAASQTAPSTSDSPCPSPLSYHFVPYGKTQLQSVGEFLTLAVQMALEDAPCGKADITVLELQNCVGANVLGPAVRRVLQERMGLEVGVKTIRVGGPDQTKLILPAKEPNTVFLAVSGPNTLAEGVRVLSHFGGFLLSRSAERPSLDSATARVVTEQRVDKDWISLLRRPAPAHAATPESTLVVQLAGSSPAPNIPGVSSERPVVLVWRGLNDAAAGVAAAVADVKRQYYAPHARMVFILDETAPEFSLKAEPYATQMQLNLPVNVLHQGVWGCWRALPLPGHMPAALSATCLDGVNIDAIGLNPRERKATSNKQMWTGHLDYVGSDGTNGSRVMGVARWLSDRRRPELDPLLRWRVPDNWSATQAATVPFAFSMVYHALYVTAGMRKGESVLIHEGASAVGQAAIRVAIQLGCYPIFTTVADEAQQKMVVSTFHQLEPRNVLSCDGVSFEWQVRTLTRGRGVNVVLSALPDNQFRASLRCMADWGRFIHYGREDMLAANTFGSHLFLRSIAVFGMSGDQLFHASERDRNTVRNAMQQGLDSGAVQPILGTKAVSSTRLPTVEDSIWIREHSESSKIVLEMPQTESQSVPGCRSHMSYVIVGGAPSEWLQVAGMLSQHGARRIVAAGHPASSGANSGLVRHRVRALRALSGTQVHFEEVRSWDEAAAAQVIKAAMKVAPIDAVVSLVNEDADAESVRVPGLLHSALLNSHSTLFNGHTTLVNGQTTLLNNNSIDVHKDAALLVLSQSAETACKLAALCEERRAAGLRTACMSGPLEGAGTLGGAADHLADMLSGARPTVTLLPVETDADRVSADGYSKRLLASLPDSPATLSQLGKSLTRLPQRQGSVRLRSLPSLGLRAELAREAYPLYVLPSVGVLDPATLAQVSELARHVLNPVVCVEFDAGVESDVKQLANSVVTAIISVRHHGPYNLLGWSLSGPLALEVTRQMEAAGHKCSTTILDGDPERVQKWAESVDDRKLIAQIVGSNAACGESPPTASWPELMAKLLPTLSADADITRPLVERGVNTVRAYIKKLARFKPQVDAPFVSEINILRMEPTDIPSIKVNSSNISSCLVPLRDCRGCSPLSSKWLAGFISNHSAWSNMVSTEEATDQLTKLA